jgi:hypothetical protein
MKSRARPWLAVLGLLLPLAAQAETARYRCEAVYTPSRSVWVRSVTLAYDAKKISQVLIDGQPVYTFMVDGSRVFTSQDNERIAFDAGQLNWQSNWRDMMTAQGRCERE